MNSFDYLRPSTIPEAVAAASAPGAAYLAAGTNLLDLMKGGLARPSRLVDITRRALEAIENIHFRREDWKKLFETYEKLIDTADTDTEMADIYARMARISTRQRYHENPQRYCISLDRTRPPPTSYVERGHFRIGDLYSFGII